jgi:hypothetical protein
MKKPFPVRFDLTLFSSIHLLLVLSLLALATCHDDHAGSTPKTIGDAVVEDNAFELLQSLPSFPFWTTR